MEIIGRNNVTQWPLDERQESDFFFVKNARFFSAIDVWELNHTNHTVKLRSYVRDWAGKYLILEALGQSEDELKQVNTIISEHYIPFFISD